jgi:tetratricopeptide (TPR) repeat protein
MRTLTLVLLLALPTLAGGVDDAKALLAKGDAQGAAEAARKLAEANASDIEAWLVLADAFFAQGSPEDAWEALEGAIGKNPAEARLSIKLGDTFLRLAEKAQRETSDGTTIMNYYLDAERNYGEALQKDAQSADALFGMANASFWQGTDEKKEQAKKLLADCLGIKEDHAKAHALQAYMFLLDGQELARQGKGDAAKEKYRAAQEKYEISLKLDGSEVLDHVRYGHSLYGQGKYAEAKKAYLTGLKKHPQSPVPIQSGLYHVANVNQQPPSWTNMGPVLEEAVKQAPTSAPAWYYLGYCRFSTEDWAGALKAYAKALEINPQDANYAYYAGYCHEQLGDAAKALDHYRQALKAWPGHSDAAIRFFNLAIVNRADVERVERLLEELVKLAPENADIHNNYALLLRDFAEGTREHQQKDPKPEVRRWLKRSGEVYEIAARLAPESAQIQSDTGLLFQFYPCNFDAAKAKAYFIRSLQLSDFTYRDAFDGLDRLCRQTGDWATLADYAERVIGSLERGNHAVAPVAGGEPQALPNETRGLMARAKAALKASKGKRKAG